MINNLRAGVCHTLGYLKNRLEERSTWAAIGVGVTGAAALVAPWNYVFIAVGVIGALVPSKGTDDA